MISAVNKQYVYHLFVVALISIKFCMFADTNMTIPGAKFPKHWFKNRYKITKKRFAYNSRTQCIEIYIYKRDSFGYHYSLFHPIYIYMYIYIYTICGIVITVGRVLNGRPEHIIVKNQRVNSCDQTFYYCQFRATQIVRYSSDKIA